MKKKYRILIEEGKKHYPQVRKFFTWYRILDCSHKSECFYLEKDLLCFHSTREKARSIINDYDKWIKKTPVIKYVYKKNRESK